MLHYEIVDRRLADSERSTLICLHGFLESLTMWEVLRLEEFSDIVLIDLPGHGKSNTEGIDSIRSMAEEVIKVIDKEKLSSYDIIGHSMGGYVGLELKGIDSRCQGLILLNSNVWADSDRKKMDRERVAKLVQTKKERFLSEAIPNLFENPESKSLVVNDLIKEANRITADAIGRASLAMSKRTDYSEQVFSGELPVVVIQGKNDSIAGKARMEQIMVNHPDRFHVVNSGHMAHWEATEAVREILSDVLLES